MIFHTLHFLMYMTSNCMKVRCQNYSYLFYSFTELVLYSMISRQLKSLLSTIYNVLDYMYFDWQLSYKGHLLSYNSRIFALFHLKLKELETKENKLRSARFTLLYGMSFVGLNILYWSRRRCEVNVQLIFVSKTMQLCCLVLDQEVAYSLTQSYWSLHSFQRLHMYKILIKPRLN